MILKYTGKNLFQLEIVYSFCVEVQPRYLREKQNTFLTVFGDKIVSLKLHRGH